MAQWGNTGTSSANTPKWGSEYIQAGSGHGNQSSNNTALFQNTTPESFGKNGIIPFQSSGVFAASSKQLANTSGESTKIGSAGWNLREAFEGPVVAVVLSVGAGSNLTSAANGEQILFSNGSSNGFATVVTDGGGNGISVSLPLGGTGRFVNTGVVASSFVRNKHLLSITVANASGSTGWTNGDLVFVGNGQISGIGVITTTASGNLASVAVNAAANGGFGAGLWSNATTNTQVTFSFSSANGSATGANLTANLTTSTGGSLSGVACGGRAGRVQYECLVGMGSLTAANNTTLPS